MAAGINCEDSAGEWPSNELPMDDWCQAMLGMCEKFQSELLELGKGGPPAPIVIDDAKLKKVLMQVPSMHTRGEQEEDDDADECYSEVVVDPKAKARAFKKARKEEKAAKLAEEKQKRKDHQKRMKGAKSQFSRNKPSAKAKLEKLSPEQKEPAKKIAAAPIATPPPEPMPVRSSSPRAGLERVKREGRASRKARPGRVGPRPGSVGSAHHSTSNASRPPAPPVVSGSTMSVEVLRWLGELNMAQYEELFKDEGFDSMNVIRVLTLEDLVGTGVKKGHARLMLSGFGDNRARSPQKPSRKQKSNLNDAIYGKQKNSLNDAFYLDPQSAKSERPGTGSRPKTPTRLEPMADIPTVKLKLDRMDSLEPVESDPVRPKSPHFLEALEDKVPDPKRSSRKTSSKSPAKSRSSQSKLASRKSSSSKKASSKDTKKTRPPTAEDPPAQDNKEAKGGSKRNVLDIKSIRKSRRESGVAKDTNFNMILDKDFVVQV